MKATTRSKLMRLAVMATAVALLLRALLFDRADVPYAIGIMAVAIAYEGLYHLAGHAMLALCAAKAAPTA